ncbi:MAG: LamG-like jellyroll fold domain-containing protein, partial [Lentisphaerota bacterium]
GFWAGLENFRPKTEILSATSTQVVAGGVGLYGSIQELPRNEWTHLAYCWSPDRNSLEIYINGVLLIAQETLAAPSFNAGPVVFAQDFMDGYLDEVRVWVYDRSWEEVEYWHNRILPAPSGYVETPLYGKSMAAYYRFDDGTSNAVDFAYLNNSAYFIPVNSAITTNYAVSLLGTDDEDGDQLPEWWVQIHNLDKYPDLNLGPTFLMGLIEDCYYTPTRGPVYTNYFDKFEQYVARVDFYRSVRAYASIGSTYAWLDPVDNKFYSPKDTTMGFDGRHNGFMKYIYLKVQPKAATLNLFTPGMTSTVAYVNGHKITADSETSNSYQVLDVTDYVRPGRNMVYIRCVSGYNKYLDKERLNLANPDYDCNHFEGVYGKFDANLVCDGVEYIRRGDHTRNDPRAVWFVQSWSSSIELGNDPPYMDKEDRALPGNLDYGLQFNADADQLTAQYEFLVKTNPRDDDSNNNGIPDDLEDFDGDGLRNGEEQDVQSNPTLPDTDDDGVWDGMDVSGDNNPVSAMSPVNSRSLVLPGTTNDYATFPVQARFALKSWTVEAWVRPSTTETNGGIIVQRVVGPKGINYELGLGNGTSGVPTNYPYLQYASEDGSVVIITNGFALTNNNWAQLAGVYDSDRREMTLYVNGQFSAKAPAVLKGPARYAGGPILQRIGYGFGGMIDEVRIWNTARTQAQIEENCLSPVSVSDPNLTGYFRFDDGTSYSNNVPRIGTSANNLSSNGVSSRPWTWGQIQDYVKSYDADWEDKWSHAASLVGGTVFSTNNGGALYTPPSLQVYILPDAVGTNGAQWRVLGLGSWHDSGYTISDDLLEDTYTITFSTLSGWTAPADIDVMLSNNVKTVVVGVYQQNGSLRVDIIPPAVTNLARWRIDGGNWQLSGVVMADMLPGFHFLEFSDVNGWNTPAPANVNILPGQLTTFLASYTPRPTALQITIQPPEVRTAGAQWRITEGDGTWLDSGTLLLVTNGDYTVEFKNVISWLRPPTAQISVEEGVVGILTGAYYRIQIWDSFATNFVGTFSKPRGMAVDSQRRMYVADQLHNRILRLTAISNDAWDAIGSLGSAMGQFNQPMDVFIDQQDNLYVADAGNNRIQMRNAITMVWTNLGLATGLVNAPRSVAVNSAGVIYVADTGNNRILKRALNGTWTEFLKSDSSGDTCGMNAPQDIVIDDEGYIYIADMPVVEGSAQARIRKISPDAICFELMGSSDTNYGGLSGVAAISLDPMHNRLLVADRENNRIMARSLLANYWTELVGPECVLNWPEGLVMDQIGNLYISDTYNDRVIRLRIDWSYISTPSVAAMSAGGSGGGSSYSSFTLQWTGQDDVFYDIQWATNLLPFPVWYSLSRQMYGSNGPMSCIDTNTRTPVKFYRIDAY